MIGHKRTERKRLKLCLLGTLDLTEALSRCLGDCQGELRERLEYAAKLQGVKGAMRLALRAHCSKSDYVQLLQPEIARLSDFAEVVCDGFGVGHHTHSRPGR